MHRRRLVRWRREVLAQGGAEGGLVAGLDGHGVDNRRPQVRSLGLQDVGQGLLFGLQAGQGGSRRVGLAASPCRHRLGRGARRFGPVGLGARRLQAVAGAIQCRRRPVRGGAVHRLTLHLGALVGHVGGAGFKALAAFFEFGRAAGEVGAACFIGGDPFGEFGEPRLGVLCFLRGRRQVFFGLAALFVFADASPADTALLGFQAPNGGGGIGGEGPFRVRCRR